MNMVRIRDAEGEYRFGTDPDHGSPLTRESAEELIRMSTEDWAAAHPEYYPLYMEDA